MGTYRYAMKSPKHVVEVTLDDGRACKAAIAYFHHKPTSDGFFRSGKLRCDWERLANMQLAAMDARWADQEFPPLMIKIDNKVGIQPGDQVYQCKPGSFYDGEEVWVGTIASVAKVKEGRKTRTAIRVTVTHPENLPE
jgi:hypothetical protein